MKQTRFTEEQVILALRQQEAKEKTTAEVCRDLGISQATFFKWKRKYGGMSVSNARHLRELEQENSRLKRMLANAMLDKEILEETVKKLWCHPAAAARPPKPGQPRQASHRVCRLLGLSPGHAKKPEDFRDKTSVAKIRSWLSAET
jgi:putative transposase